MPPLPPCNAGATHWKRAVGTGVASGKRIAQEDRTKRSTGTQSQRKKVMWIDFTSDDAPQVS